MKILIFNNKDIKNPNSGGSEVFTHEIAKRWAILGNEVTMVTSDFKSGAEREVIDDVEIIRLGNAISVYMLAENYYKKNLKDKYDVIIDEYTYRPFLTPRFAGEKIIFLVHELAREKYFYVLPPLLSHAFFYYFEPNWLKNYLDTPVVTVSNSTKEDLLHFGFKEIYIVSEGINFKPVDNIPKKEANPTLLFVGLLKKVNLVNHVIESFRVISEKLPNAKLWIVGRGPELDNLKKASNGLDVTFFGYVPNDIKLDLMRRSHVLLVPAVREGWGLVVTEANACGTIAIGYDVPGLRDSIKNGITGYLTENNPNALAIATLNYLNDVEMQSKLAYNALGFSRMFSWEKTANEFLELFEVILGE